MYQPLSPEIFAFLRELRENNNTQWFADNRARYRERVQMPMIGFIERVAPWLERHAPDFVADTRLNGGSLFRIQRDTRFSADKSPFKTNIGCNFRHHLGKDAHAPGFYVHIAPDEIFFGGGIWAPPTPALNAIRDAIVEKPKRWEKIVRAPAFVAGVGGLADAPMLKNVPRGYDKEFAFAEDLKRKSLYAFGTCTEEDVCAPDFPDRVTRTFEAMVPFMQFLLDALAIERR